MFYYSRIKKSKSQVQNVTIELLVAMHNEDCEVYKMNTHVQMILVQQNKKGRESGEKMSH